MIKNDPSELPSVLINQKTPKFETLSLLSNQKFLYEIDGSGHISEIYKEICRIIYSLET